MSLAYCIITAFSVKSEPLLSSVSISPLILLKDRKVSACGLTVLAGPPENRLVTEVKVEHKEGHNIFSIRARPHEPQKGTALTDIQLTTRSLDSRSLFPKVRLDEDGYLLLQSPLDDSSGAQLMQEILVTGGAFHLTTQKGDTLSIELPRPLPHSLRLAYLSCAGDLIGPEPE